ncbi:response regulator [Alphaproteobacteria bacterium]|nr:response regulator [Alphaproteobacteria bacterium]
MNFEPKIHIIRDHIEQTLETFTHNVRESKGPVWRCFYAQMPSNFEIEQENKHIVLQFLADSFSDADHVEVFWLTSGHLFIFFQGHVGASIKGFESFLNKTKNEEQQEATEYHFFWELDHFWGYFDEVLARVFETKISEDSVHSLRAKRSKPLLLILEDDRTTRHFIHAMIKEHCDIVVAWNAPQAERLYKNLMPDMAFLDIQVPYGDGDDLAVTLRAFDPDAFIVMVSGALNPATEKRCLEAGVKGCLHKPPEEKALLSFLKQYKEQSLNQTASA